jgi:hypothetical protein
MTTADDLGGVTGRPGGMCMLDGDTDHTPLSILADA